MKNKDQVYNEMERVVLSKTNLSLITIIFNSFGDGDAPRDALLK